MSKETNQYFKVREYGSGQNVVFIFGGWRIPLASYKLMVSRLRHEGFTCVVYVPKRHLIAIGTPYSQIVSAVRATALDVQRRIALQPSASYSAFGISFGTLFALETAKHCKAIRKVVLVAPFGDFTDHVRQWRYHRYFGKVLHSQPTETAESAQILNSVGFATGQEQLQGKDFLIYYGTNDTTIHTAATESMIARLTTSGITITPVRFRGGHFTPIAHLVWGKHYIPFLRDK